MRQAIIHLACAFAVAAFAQAAESHTVRGFIMRHAATPWAPPPAEQVGLIGTHWGKGWIIENHLVSHSRCPGITLGKYGDGWDNTSANTAEGYVKTIERALMNGWNKDTTGWMARNTQGSRVIGGARGSKGSSALQRRLSRWCRMRSTIRGSVMKETIRMRVPQEHARGSASKIFLIRRAHVLRASLDDSALSRSFHESAAASTLSPSRRAVTTLRRLE
jgi:hypothetical protein